MDKNFWQIFRKVFFKGVLSFFFICAIVYSIFYFGWFENQANKLWGMYYVYKGDKAYKKADLPKAIENYNKGLEIYPEHYGAWFNLGNIYVVYEDYYAAADAYQQAIQNKPGFTLARMNYGIISTEKLGNFDEAISQYKEIVNRKNRLWFIPFVFNNKKSEKLNKGLAYYNMGLAYRQRSFYGEEDGMKAREDLESAISAYKNADKILKDNYNLQYNLALAYQLANDYNSAGLTYCKAIEIEPMNYEAHYNLSILLRHLKMYQEAYNEIEKASILISDNGNTNTKSYVFDILNDISQTLVKNDKYSFLVEKMDDEPTGDEITYVNGKIVATDALDRAILKNFRECETEKFFNK